jgi:hypothetical protein
MQRQYAISLRLDSKTHKSMRCQGIFGLDVRCCVVKLKRGRIWKDIIIYNRNEEKGGLV